jgi:tetratricopeptide (TPR) repeat protein
MFRKFNFLLMCIVLTTALAGGCKPKQPAMYFKTPFQNESEFIVQTIVSDLAEQMFYAKFHKLPAQRRFLVTVTERPGSSRNTPVYDVQIRLTWRLKLKTEVDVHGPIWSPEVYQDVAEQLANTIGLSAGNVEGQEDTTLLSNLADDTPEAILDQNSTLSLALQDDFTDPVLHEKAAALLGVFTMREHSGYFYDTRFPLSRITAHLVMAHFLGGGHAYGINGQIANAILLTFIGDETPALKQLSAINTNDVAVAPFVRALQARNTGDYRPLDAMNGLTQIESTEWFCVMSESVDGAAAWPKLSNEQKQIVDFVRVANQVSHSVEMGHQLLDTAIPLELQEIKTVYESLQHKALTDENMTNALNELPDRCFTSSDGVVHVCVIGWGQWAAFLQRQLCHAIQEDFNMLQYMWGVPDDAKKFALAADADYAGLRLYPFVRRMDSTEVDSYHESTDDCIKLTTIAPQLIPSGCWYWFYEKVGFAPPYPVNFNSHINEWFNDDPLPGTVYDLTPRMIHPTLIGRPNVVAFFEKLHDLAPYDSRISDFILKKKYNNHPTYDQAMELYSNLLPYSVTAIWQVANTVTDQPARYEDLMLQGTNLSPTFYYGLGDYYYNRGDEEKSAQYYDQGCDADSVSVRVSNYALWRMRYYLKKGQTDKARQIAYDGAQVYSSMGLQAEALFFELTSNYDDAFDWYSKIDERYQQPDPLIEFCMRYKILTGDSRFDPELNKRIGNIFPEGIEPVAVSDFHGPPADGVLVKQENDKTKAVGLGNGDVIVAVYGYRMHNYAQYTYGREWSTGPKLDLIVWNGSAYHEVTANLPTHRFGVDFGDYTSK